MGSCKLPSPGPWLLRVARVPGRGGQSPGPLGAEEDCCLAAGSSPGLAGAMSFQVSSNDFAFTVLVGVESGSWAPTHLSITLHLSCSFPGACVLGGEAVDCAARR